MFIALKNIVLISFAFAFGFSFSLVRKNLFINTHKRTRVHTTGTLLQTHTDINKISKSWENLSTWVLYIWYVYLVYMPICLACKLMCMFDWLTQSLILGNVCACQATSNKDTTCVYGQAVNRANTSSIVYVGQFKRLEDCQARACLVVNASSYTWFVYVLGINTSMSVWCFCIKL